jgi:threonine/homoserine/homoserine lactone efflux protein
MTFQTRIAFAVAAGIVLVMPGPTILAVISHSLAHGRKAVVPLVIGVTLGDFMAMSLSFLGLGAILSVSAALFSILKLLGALYLIYLGARLLRSNPKSETSATAVSRVPGRRLLINLFAITAFNPKSIAFFIAFLPQFITPSAKPSPQFFILGGTFLVLAVLNATIYALFSGHLREKVQSTEARRWFNRFGGAALIGAGMLTATVRRSS